MTYLFICITHLFIILHVAHNCVSCFLSICFYKLYCILCIEIDIHMDINILY